MLRKNSSLRFLNKKGLNEVVSMVLLIAFIVALGLVVFSWGNKILGVGIEKSKIKIGTDLECANVNVQLEGDANNIILKNNNKDNLVLSGFVSRYVMDDGKAIVDYAHVDQEIKNFDAFQFGLEEPKINSDGTPIINFNIDNLDTVEIIPKVDVEGQIVDCENKKAKWKRML